MVASTASPSGKAVEAGGGAEAQQGSGEVGCSMEELVGLCKRRGFVFPSSEVSFVPCFDVFFGYSFFILVLFLVFVWFWFDFIIYVQRGRGTYWLQHESFLCFVLT